MLILQYKVSLITINLFVAFVPFMFMLALLCFFVLLPFLGE